METIKIDTSLAKVNTESIRSITESLEQCKLLTKSFSESLKSMVESYSYMTGALTGISEMSQVIRDSMGEYVKLDMSYVGANLLSESSLALVRELQKFTKSYDQTYILGTVEQMRETLRIFSDSLISEQLRSVDYATILSTVVSPISSMSEVLDTIYDVMPDEIIEDTSQEERFTEEELQEAIQEQVSNPIKFQERCAEWTEKKKKQYFIIWFIITIILEIFIKPYAQEKVGLPVMTYVESQVKELPQKGANILCKIKEGIEATIVEDANYYYKVRFIDENGEEKEGFVAKRNLRIIKDANDTIEKTSEGGND